MAFLSPIHVAPRILALAAGAVLAVTAANVANVVLLDGGSFQLDANAEGNALTWASSAAAFAAGLLALLGWTFSRDRRLLALAAVLAFFSLDDALELHEGAGGALGSALGLPDWSVRLWLVLYLPLVAVAALLVLRLAASAAPETGRRLRLGLVLAATGFAIEIVGPVTKWIASRGIAWPNAIRVGVEEGVELAAWLVLATGLALLLSAVLARSDA